MLLASLDLPRCCEITEQLSAFLDDELDDATKKRVALHLAMCEACAQLEAELAATVYALHRLRLPAQPGALHGTEVSARQT